MMKDLSIFFVVIILLILITSSLELMYEYC